MTRWFTRPAERLDREEKLFFLALVVYFLMLLAGWLRHGSSAESWPARAAHGSLFLLALPAYLGLRRAPALAGRAWFGWAFGAIVAAALVLVAFFQPSGGASSGPSGAGEFVRTFHGGGAPSLIALMLLFTIPCSRFLRAWRHGNTALRGVGFAGLLLVAGYALLALSRPLFDDAALAGFYLLSVAVLYAVARQYEREHYATPVTRRATLSVTVIAMNEADRIDRCLASVAGWADEIIVLDSGSTDGTAEIARRYTDKTVVTDWPGYGPQKQRALELATCEWVLSIDADEELTPELRHDIDAALGPNPACVGYRLNWGVIVYGRLLDFGRSARAPLRLFLRVGSRFTDAQVHETVVLPPGSVGRLRGRLLHYTQRDFGHALDKVAKYGWLGAQKRYASGQWAGGLVGATLRGAIVFLQVYLVRLGFLDGQAGFLTAALYGQVAFDKYAGLWALRRERGHS